jgi:hypothetical protein
MQDIMHLIRIHGIAGTDLSDDHDERGNSSMVDA